MDELGGQFEGAELGNELAHRKAKVEEWRSRGIDPYGSKFVRTHCAAEIVVGLFRAGGRRGIDRWADYGLEGPWKGFIP